MQTQSKYKEVHIRTNYKRKEQGLRFIVVREGKREDDGNTIYIIYYIPRACMAVHIAASTLF